MEHILHDPTFWVATAFIAFLGVLVYFKVPGMVSGALDERADKIKADIEEAERLREEAQKLLAEYQKKQRDAQKAAEGIVTAAKEEAERLAKQGEQRLKDSLARREKQAMDRLAQAEAAALEQVKAHTVDIAMAATRQVLTDSIKGAKATKLIDDAIGGLSGKLH